MENLLELDINEIEPTICIQNMPLKKVILEYLKKNHTNIAVLNNKVEQFKNLPFVNRKF